MNVEIWNRKGNSQVRQKILSKGKTEKAAENPGIESWPRNELKGNVRCRLAIVAWERRGLVRLCPYSSVNKPFSCFLFTGADSEAAAPERSGLSRFGSRKVVDPRLVSQNSHSRVLGITSLILFRRSGQKTTNLG